MKQIFTAPNIVTCDLLKSVLEARGIKCLLKNEYGSAVMGERYPVAAMPTLAFTWPEIWVTDENADEAALIAADFQKCSAQKSETSA